MSEALFTLVITTTLLLGSPGPAPIALAATGAACGIRKGTPFLLGILAGLSIAIVGATVGLAALFSAWPEIRVTVQVLGALYILYVAFKIATAPVSSTGPARSAGAPAFIDGFILNLLNPKAYAAFLAIFSQFLLPFSSTFASYVATALICIAIAAIVDFVWLSFGGAIRPLFQQPTQARLLRIVFAILMVVAVGAALL